MNKRPTQRNQRSTTDLILFVAAIFLLFYIPWKEMNSFHHLLLFLYILCVMLRITNIRKVKMREMEMARRKAEQEQAAALTDSQPVKENESPSSAPAEAISAQEQNPDDKPEENSSSL